MTLGDLFGTLRRFRVVAALAAVLVLGLAALAALLPPDRYTASTLLIVRPAKANDPNSNIALLNALQYVMPSLAIQAESRRAKDLVRNSLAGDPAVAGAAVTIATVPDPSGSLTISATSGQRGAVAAWANATATAVRTLQPANDFLQLVVIDEARTPDAPSGPPRGAVLLGGLVLAGIAGLFATQVAAALSRRAALSDELSRRLGVPVLAELPRIARRHRDSLTVDAVAQDRAETVVLEALQRLRTGLEVASAKHRPEALCVTSLRTGEGKSTIASLLAWSLASAGYPVRIADADLRLPTQHLRFHARLSPGLANVGHVPVEGLLQPTGLASLTVLTAGLAEGHPGDVLDFALPHLLADGAAHGVTTLIDTAPIQAVAETMRTALMVGFVVIVVDARTLRIEELERTVQQLRASDVVVLGIVVNRAARVKRRTTTSDYYAYRRRTSGAHVAIPTSVASQATPIAPTKRSAASPSRPGTPDPRGAGGRAGGGARGV